MTHEPRINVMYEETENLGNFNSRKRSIGIYGIPRSASPEYVADMVDTAEMAIGQIRARLSGTPAPVIERKANHRALDEIPEPLEAINETGIDITSSTGLGCVVCGDTEELTECDLGMVCPTCLMDIAEDNEGGTDPGDADQNGQPEPVSLAIDPPSLAEPDTRGNQTGNPARAIDASGSVPNPSPVTGLEHPEESRGKPLASDKPEGHPEGCHCQDCGWDPFKDGADDIPCPQGCQCATCLDKGKKCATCQKEKPDLAIWWRQTDGTLLCHECKGTTSAEVQAPKYEGPAKAPEMVVHSEKPGHELAQSFLGDDSTVWSKEQADAVAAIVAEHNAKTTETDPRAHVYNGPVCERCGMGEIATTHCPGTVITAAQGQNIVRGLMDYINGGWKVAGAPGNTHKFPGNNEPLKNDLPAAECLPPTESGAPVEQSAGSVEIPRSSPPQEAVPSEMAAPAPSDIPGEDEISTKLSIFGVDVDIPPMEWAKVPITEVSTEGEGGGQLKALNTVLSLIGYKGKDRHWASLAILHAAFGPFRGTLDSLKDLTKAEAHVILSYLDAATPESNVLLFDAACAMKGQIPLRLSPEVTEEVAA